MNVDFDAYGFIPPSSDASDEYWHSNGINVIVGDYNLNGFPDLMTVLTYKMCIFLEKKPTLYFTNIFKHLTSLFK